nr:integrase, catalytic region, zinc finger, CCHC-type, peptidase aspartic, catalytic [Tanacetum cinerariifolium]
MILFLKAGLGYKNLKRLKKAIAAQPKMYHGEKLCCTKLKIESPDSEDTLKDAEETRLKMRNKMVQLELDELMKRVNQKAYAYADVRSQNQDLLMTISELENKIKTIEKGKNVNTKFDKSETSGTRLCVTPLPKNIAVKAKKVSNTKVNTDRSKPVTSHSIPKNEQSQKRNSRVKKALFTSPIAEKSKNLGATFVVAKSRFSVAKTPTATTKVIQLVLRIVDSGCSKHMTGNLHLLRNFVEKFIGTVHSGMITSQQSLDMEIMFKEIS